MSNSLNVFSGCKFLSSGREDVDVRMLGRGRPFAVELLDPHRTQCSLKQMSVLSQTINLSTKDIAVRDLQVVTKEQLAPLKEDEESKRKNYVALCVVLDGLPVTDEQLECLNLIDLTLQQKTPLRVLHRQVRRQT